MHGTMSVFQTENANRNVLLSEEDGCVPGCRMGKMKYFSDTYLPDAVHDNFQESFYVLSGSGYVKLNGEEHEISQGMASIIPIGVTHTLKKTSEELLEVFWFCAIKH